MATAAAPAPPPPGGARRRARPLPSAAPPRRDQGRIPGASYLPSSIARLAAVAAGDRPADLIVRDCSLVSVYTGEVLRGTDVAVSGDRIAYVGPDASHARGPRTRLHDARGRHACPGLADPHVHLDQFVLPSEFAARAALRGTTSMFSDPIDIVRVAGQEGLAEFARLCGSLPVRIFQAVPGGLPVEPRFGHGPALSPEEEAAAAARPDVACMGEVFSWTKITARNAAAMRSVASMLGSGCPVNGHTAGASGAKLNAYAAAGIHSCHEPIDGGQAAERLRLGMWVMAREGSIRRDLRAILAGLRGSGARLDRLMLCSDGVDPLDLERHGHMDRCVREAAAAGVPPAEAIAMASRNCFDHYGMSRDLGGVAPGRLADIVVLDDLESFRVSDVFVGGAQTVASGRLAASRPGARRQPPRRRPRAWTRRTVMLRRLSPADFAVRPRGRGGAAERRARVEANTIDLATEIVTRRGAADLEARDGNVRAASGDDIWKAAAFDRVRGSGRSAVAFLRGFGADGIGAFASTWSFHENDLVVIGRDEADMAAAANAVIATRGGMAVVSPSSGGRGRGSGGIVTASAAGRPAAPGLSASPTPPPPPLPSRPGRGSSGGSSGGSGRRPRSPMAARPRPSGGGADGPGRRRLLASMPLEFAGIASTAPFDEAAGQFRAVNEAIADAGCPLARPHLVPLFLPFLALPSVRLLHAGMVDVRSRTLIPALAGRRN